MGSPSSPVRTSISGSWSASWASAARSAGPCSRRTAVTDASSVGGAKWCSAVEAPVAEAVADPDRGEAVQPADLPGADRVCAHPPPRSNSWTPATLPSAAVGQVEPLPGADRAGEHPDVGDLLPGRAALDLEHPARRLAVRVRPSAAGSRVADPGHQLGDAGPGGRRAGVHRVQHAGPGLGGELRPQLRRRTARRPSTYAASRASSCSASAAVSPLAEGARRRVGTP